MKIENVANGYDEYKFFLSTYLLPIIGISYNNNLQKTTETTQNVGRFIRQEENHVIFSTSNQDVFFVESKQRLADDAIALARKIIPAFFRVSKYMMSGTFKKIKMDYPSDVIHEENIRLAIQKGICDWCTGGDNMAVYGLLQILEQWSVQTYEGKKVTFGFVVDMHCNASFDEDSADEESSWFAFLKDDYAATLSDCIHSVIQLDKNCIFSRYLSITENNIIPECELGNRLPYRFAQVINTYVTGDRVGIFLLNNGDIVLSKNKAIRLIKRNLRWLNLSYDAFSNAINEKYKNGNLNPALLGQVYASMLDVSFSHTGGIIAIVSDISKLLESTSQRPPILDMCDNLQDKRTVAEIEEKMRTSSDENGSARNQEVKKRLLKRKAILGLINGKNFSEIDRKLRMELISMDGACILDLEGNVYAVGAIIQNDSGSSGGGRSAAAKKLSRYGMAVKISTDGYIEVFVNNEAIYAIK